MDYTGKAVEIACSLIVTNTVVCVHSDYRPYWFVKLGGFVVQSKKLMGNHPRRSRWIQRKIEKPRVNDWTREIQR